MWLIVLVCDSLHLPLCCGLSYLSSFKQISLKSCTGIDCVQRVKCDDFPVWCNFYTGPSVSSQLQFCDKLAH